MVSRHIDSYITYKILSILSSDWKDLDAYDLGIVDENGNQLKTSRQLKTAEEKNAYTLLDRLVFKLKRMINRVPRQARQFATYAAALALLREDYDLSDNDMKLIKEEIHGAFGHYGSRMYGSDINMYGEHHIEKGSKVRVGKNVGEVIKWDGEVYHVRFSDGDEVTVKDGDVEPYIEEEVAANSSAGGINIAGLDDNPPVRKRREPDDKFSGSPVFDVEPGSKYMKRFAKEKHKHWKKYLNKLTEDDEDGIMDYARRNPTKGIIIRNKMTGEMRYIRQPRKK